MKLKGEKVYRIKLMSNSKSPRSSWNKNLLPYGNITRKHSFSVTVRKYIQSSGKRLFQGKGRSDSFCIINF
jgi:hypothetical protein